MIRIDLRFVAPIVAFYIPAILFMTLCWMAGYSTAEIRDVVVLAGGLFGAISAMITVLFYSTEACGPQWFYIIEGEKE
jgi:hypothetical protein